MTSKTLSLFDLAPGKILLDRYKIVKTCRAAQNVNLTRPRGERRILHHRHQLGEGKKFILQTGANWRLNAISLQQAQETVADVIGSLERCQRHSAN